MSADSTAILVLGMHRSGTSALTRVLNLLGAHVGSDLLAARADNAGGFWEHAEAVAIHDRLLAALGRSWHDARELPSGWMQSTAGKVAAGEVKRLIERDMKDERLWAVKDPRMCRLAPLWIQVLRDLGIATKAVLVARDPFEVARSLHVRDGWTHRHAYLMWMEHLLEAIRATADVPRALVSYQQLLEDWRTHMRRLAGQLELVWDPGIEQAGPAVEAYLAPGERHHDVLRQSPDVQAEQAPPPCLRNLYAACVETSLDKNWHRLAEFDSQFSAMSSVFDGPMDEVIIERDAARRHGTELERLALERLERIYQLEAESRAAQTLALERIELIHQLQGDLARLQRAELDLAVRTSELHQVRGQLEHLFLLAGSRLWALKRVLRPLRPPQPKGEVGKD